MSQLHPGWNSLVKAVINFFSIWRASVCSLSSEACTPEPVVNASAGKHETRVARIDVGTGKETKVADLGPVPAVFEAAERMKTQIYLMQDFDHAARFADRWLHPGN
jgi:hypothetical protein